MIADDFALRGVLAANKLSEHRDHGPGRGAAGTNRTEWAHAGPGGVLVVEVETVEAGARQPLMSPFGQVHRQVDVPAECAEPGRVETAYGGNVARHGADRQVLVAAETGFLGHPADEHAADALAASRLGEDDRP